MSNGSSATNWIIGCLVAGVVCVFVCAGGAFFFVRWGVQRQRTMVGEMQRAEMEAARARDRAQMEMARAQMEMAKQTQLAELASDWSVPAGWTPPPVDAPHDALLPLLVGAWKRTSQTTTPSIPVVNVDREALSGVYTANGRTLDVYVCSLADDEREAVFQQAQSAIVNANTTTGASAAGDGPLQQTFFYLSLAGQGRGGLLSIDGRLFFIHAADSQTPLSEFMTDYFAGIDAGRPSPDSRDSSAVTASGESESPEQPSPESESADSPPAASDSSQTPAP